MSGMFCLTFSTPKKLHIVPKDSYETESPGVLKYGAATNILWTSRLQLTNHIFNKLLEMLAFVDLNSQHPTLQVQPQGFSRFVPGWIKF